VGATRDNHSLKKDLYNAQSILKRYRKMIAELQFQLKQEQLKKGEKPLLPFE